MVPRCDGASGRFALQRLYSTFPGGRPGIGLLLLRVAVGLAAAAGGVFYFPGSSKNGYFGLVLIVSGAALAAGFLTPLVGLLIGICFLGIALSWFPAPAWVLHLVKLMAFGMIVSAIALALLGPGVFFSRWPLVWTARNCDSAVIAYARIMNCHCSTAKLVHRPVN